ncbi:uncharacterized protein [Primulina eburnea]|uniref:uncharacterized protein n=1 Tax=Primulina eburnea TaxID=1245227 RepID=UPI003C6C1603
MDSSLLASSYLKPSPPNIVTTTKSTVPFKPYREKFLPFVCCRIKLEQLPISVVNAQELVHSTSLVQIMVQKSAIAVAASLAIVFCSGTAHAGIFSGFPGIESVPGPQLPSIDFLTRYNEENQKKYAENDARFKESPILKKLLEQTKLNKEKNRQQILDKYCVRGAEWGVGDCSAEGMSPEERDKFISMLKQKAGME